MEAEGLFEIQTLLSETARLPYFTTRGHEKSIHTYSPDFAHAVRCQACCSTHQSVRYCASGQSHRSFVSHLATFRMDPCRLYERYTGVQASKVAVYE